MNDTNDTSHTNARGVLRAGFRAGDRLDGTSPTRGFRVGTSRAGDRLGGSRPSPEPATTLPNVPAGTDDR